MTPLRLESDSRSCLPLGGFGVFLMWVIRQQLDLLRMGGFDGGPVAPGQEAAGARRRPAKALRSMPAAAKALAFLRSTLTVKSLRQSWVKLR